MKGKTKSSAPRQRRSIQRSMMKSKIHRATVTEANLDYEGSITIDARLLKLADILPYEEVAVYNVTNGERFYTYAIPGPVGQGDICVNGAAAHKAKKGNLVIIASYATTDDEELARQWKPKVVHVNGKNQPARTVSRGERAFRIPHLPV